MIKIKKTTRFSYLLSFFFHVVVILLFTAITFDIDHEEEEFVTIGFGSFGKSQAPGSIQQRSLKRDNDKNVEVPTAKNTDDENIITESKKDEKDEKREPLINRERKENQKDLIGLGDGSFGIEIDFGGKGVRKVYSYLLPAYPEGVSKEIDIKLRFTIMPDGSVGRIFPLIKADTRLEVAAINSLRQWRFEPLPSNKKQSEQTAVIVFPYRLR
ncbi:MAG: energy transducer TonB [Melioribacteraceae bacterium]|nr:energy transducer TonB [Melioribacteraceae bacterium]MCF8354594.1 energy transducer TonB [Melioribacteraceae bacterium]MCF8394946.1 energy transducer TonB [Melioribacteraceae bacterium]MCF8420171.1 energy transducer TonB [Melioribacteraceae bacterium]